MKSFDNWKNNQLEQISKHQVTSTDIVQVYSIRKQLFVNHLCTYTENSTLMIAIFKELEEFHSFIQKYAIDTLLEIANEELNKNIRELELSRKTLHEKNLLVQEHKEELQALNEELATTNEELSAANEELSAANEELHASNEEKINYIAQIESVKNELKLSRDYYLTLLHDFPSLIWRCNLDAKCDYFNNTWLKFTGRTMEQEYGDGWAEGVHPDDLQYCFQIFIKNFNERKAFDMIYRMKRYDGEYRYILDYGKPIYGVDNEFKGFLGACFDITEQKELSEALTILNTQLLESNKELQKTEALLKKSYNELEEKVQERTVDLQAAKDEISSLLMREKAAHKEVNHKKNQLKAINAELKEKNEELFKINVDLDNFIYTASHDLKAPVTNIEGLMNLLKKQLKEKIGAEDKIILEMMDTSIKKFKKTILDLTEITKAQKGYDDAKESLSLKVVLDEVKSDLESIIKESNAIIRDHFDVNNVFYSPHNLRSIFYNLLSNAIKYRSPDRLLIIEISSKINNEYVIISFSDNGLGISDQHKPKLFTMFKRFHTHVDGTGIGLYVIKRILENNKGKIEFENNNRVGSTFNVYIKQKQSGVILLRSN
ncbi:MAG: ATP-binding protein, partial [Bacteroidota bacterium]|nr:ATP-binding protein [Bacteroidota bacterium]